MSLAEQVEVFHGPVTESAARVYVQCRGMRGGGEWSISGLVRGPRCEGVRTLPHSVALQDLGEGPTLLATATVVDPSWWSFDLPARYDFEVELCRHGEVVETVRRSLGFRMLGADGRDLRWQGKRWVLRGVWTSDVFPDQVAEWCEQRLSLVVSQPTEDLLDAASSHGLLLAVKVDPKDAEATTSRLARWPAVAIIVLPNDFENDFEEMERLRSVAPNILRARHVVAGDVVRADDTTDVIFHEADQFRKIKQVAESCPLPLVAVRRSNEQYAAREARAACDQLQRDLATVGDFAGYVV